LTNGTGSFIMPLMKTMAPLVSTNGVSLFYMTYEFHIGSIIYNNKIIYS